MSIPYFCTALLFYLSLRFLTAQAAHCIAFLRCRKALSPFLPDAEALGKTFAKRLRLLISGVVLGLILTLVIMLTSQVTVLWAMGMGLAYAVTSMVALCWYTARDTRQLAEIPNQSLRSLPSWLKDARKPEAKPGKAAPQKKKTQSKKKGNKK